MSQDKNTTKVVFSEHLRLLMSERNVKQADLAAKIGVSQAAVSKWLKGSIPKGDQLFAISDYFNVGMEWLLTGKDPEWDGGVANEEGKRIEAELRELAARSPAETAAEDDEEKRRQAKNMLALMEENEALRKALAEANRKIDLARKALKVLAEE